MVLISMEAVVINYIYIAIAENAEAGQFFPTGVLTADADASTNR